ncbi:two-component system sporulation sensor kinase A [Bacillus mesophilus]|uniref:histidine kinase n=1 Tax=Bacillus mesophilus TaxID=1808955 RepID=A0A6M0QBH0_9BACI|nr:ATP-binding protein [Bacillus mesophilus]MBM7663005.1 two-component system sporulation sensor kinase A [Bacillus mesophilus]NEY73673.1 PAS domain S-box protein [Bacillus mesophilus]
MVITRLLENKTINFKSLFNLLEDMVFVIKVEANEIYRCIEVNEAYLKGTGLQKEQLLSKSVDDIVSPEDSYKIKERYRASIHSKNSLTYEESMTLNGVYKTFETTILPVFDENTHCSFIIGIARDISKRKYYQEEQNRTKEKFQKVIHHQQGLIFSVEKVDHDYFYTLFDGQLIKQFYQLPSQVVGKRPQDIMETEKANVIIDHYNHCWYRQEKVVFEETDQNNLILLTVINPVIEQGKTTSIIGSTIDITEKRKTEEALVKTEKLSLLGELSAGIGHEIRNPLTTIKGFIKMMKEDRMHIKPEFLDVISSEVESIDRIAGELMMLAKPQALQTNTFNIVNLLQDVLFLMESQAFTQGVTLEITTISPDIYINGDQNQVKQVFFNLIKNSIESMEVNTKGKVQIICDHTHSEVVIKVIDEGCGITSEKIKSIGEPFYTTKTKGNGLGLMITQRIIRNHNGSLHCESEVGKGTTFTISFPIIE